MPSVIKVKEKTVNNRVVVSFSKNYADQEYQVFVPKEHATEILRSLLEILNEDNADGEELVLLRKGQVGNGDGVETLDGELLKEQVLVNLADTLFDGDTALAVEQALCPDDDRRRTEIEMNRMLELEAEGNHRMGPEP